MNHTWDGLKEECEKQALMKLEEAIGESMPLVKAIKNDTFGVLIEDGHVCGLGFHNKNIKSLSDLKLFRYLKYMNLSHCKTIDFLSFSDIRYLKSLKTLNLSYCEVLKPYYFSRGREPFLLVKYPLVSLFRSLVGLTELKTINLTGVPYSEDFKEKISRYLSISIISSPLNPDIQYDHYLKGKVGQRDLINHLTLFLEDSRHDYLRIKSLEILECLTLNEDKAIFSLIENLIISDENPFIRSLAVKIMLKNFIKKDSSALYWTIKNDRSPLVLKTVCDIVWNTEADNFKSLKSVLSERLEKLYEVNAEEAKVFLEIQELRHEFEVGQSSLLYKKQGGHITELNLSWSYLFELPNSIGNLLNLRSLQLANNYLKKLPESFKNLINLQELNLGGNFWEEIPEMVFEIAKREYASKYLGEGVCFKEAAVLGLLEILSFSKLIKINSHVERYIDQYELNQEGHIVSLYMRKHKDAWFSRLSIIPEQISILKHLERVDLSYNQIKVIPEQLSSLKNLKNLDINCNLIETIPKSILKLKKLNFLY